MREYNHGGLELEIDSLCINTIEKSIATTERQ